MDVRFIQVPDSEALERMARTRILRASERAIEQRGVFSLVLAGGSTPKPVYASLGAAHSPWTCWQIFFSDERCVPVNDAARNSQLARRAWLDHIDIPRANIHPFEAERGARHAAQRANVALGEQGIFDLVLLGLGADGHTASLFPGHTWGEVAGSPDVLAVYDAPKPPPERVSMSAYRLSCAREVIFLVDGEDKRDAVRMWRARARIPASAITPDAGVDVLLTAASIGP